MLNMGTHVGTPSPLPPQHVMGVPISPRDPLPAKGAQRIPAGPHPEPPQRAWGCGKLIRHEKREICSALQNSDGSQEGSEAPSPIPAARTPPHLCGAGGCQGWIPIPIPAVLVGSPEPRVLDIPSQAGTGWAGKKGDSGPTALMDSFPMSGLRQLAAHSFVSLPDLLGDLKGCCYL